MARGRPRKTTSGVAQATPAKGNGNGATLDFAPVIPLRRMTQAELDAFLERAADILRGNVDHSEFRGYVFALLFFKRISDLFDEAVRTLAKRVGDELANDPAMQKKSLPLVVPPDCTWDAVTVGTAEKRVTSLQLGQSLNDAMLAIERANAPKFDGILTNRIDFNKTDELPRDKLVNLKNHFASRRFDRAHVPDAFRRRLRVSDPYFRQQGGQKLRRVLYAEGDFLPHVRNHRAGRTARGLRLV
jgi:hypothetical protein